ncbi:MAG: BP74-related protein, partial [Pseudobdellovibrionaceae bacterium]
SPWSWQVVEAQNYADFAHISCDGTPALVEERLNSWLQETGGTICFWNYRVVRELTLRELTQQFTQQPLGTKDGFLPLARGFLPRTRLQSSLYSD